MYLANSDYQEKMAAQAAARKFAADQLKIAFPHLVPVSEKNNRLVAAAKNIRIELARSFPGIKFSVKSERFSMGNAIRISWTDGPTSAQVEEISKKYEAGDFDGMTDCYNYRKDHAWPDAFGDSKYISHSREYSPALVQTAIDYLWDKYCPEVAKVTPEEYETGKTWSIIIIKNGHHNEHSAQTQIHRFACKYDCMTKKLADDYIG
jgi:hypothetical protein